jgi:curved DNA-binding protein CbpA
MKYSIDEIKSALELLNIPEKASLLEIKKVYKDLLFQWHPDRCRGKKEIFYWLIVKITSFLLKRKN